MAMEGKRVAVIGSGITGLSSAWLLHRNKASVTLFEKEATCGGHTLTDESSPYPIDLGFQVYNLTTYPNFVGFLECLGVDTEPSDMSFALSMDDGALEWGSHDLSTVFAQRKTWTSPSHWRMVWEVVRFGREAPKVLDPSVHHLYRDMTLGEYLTREGYSRYFVNNYVAPMCAAVWSVPNQQVLGFPVQMLIRFWVNHHLLDITQRPLWRVVKGRSREYVKRVCAELPDVRTSCGVVKVVRAGPDSSPGTPAVTVTTDKGETLHFDAVVFATHSDITLSILGQGASQDERDVLEAIPYNVNDIYLHTDPALMPKDRKVWASWNFLGTSGAEQDTAAVCVSYWANRLQHLPQGAPDIFVTLNPPKPPGKDHVFRRLKLAHPVFSFKSWEAQSRVAELQGKQATFFAGAWCGYGFHEDGIRAAVAAVTAMGCVIPWTCRVTSPKVTLTQQWFMKAFDSFAKGAFKTGHLRIILPNGHELSYGDPHFVFSVPAGEEWRGRPAPRATLRVFNMDFFRKIVLRHDTGLGEAYMEEDFECDDVAALMSVIVQNAYQTEEVRGNLGVLNWIGDRLLYMAHLAKPNTIEGSRRNIEEHYDAGNAMYKVFLDESMMYSCAIHTQEDNGDLYTAQMRKLDAVIEAADIQPGDRVLEIGCGWGAFAIRAVQKTGCTVTGLTLSKEQLHEANARVKAAGLSGQIDLRFCDYRDLPGEGQYDKVVSIEMIEAVGHENLPTYFHAIGRFLKPGGKAVIQAIATPDDRYEAYKNSSDFIRTHIFPGGHLVCIGACVEAARGTGLTLHQTKDIGPDYAITLREWRRRWDENKEQVLKLGYSERFFRKYRFYFGYCEAGFDGRYIHDYHLTWVKDNGNSTVFTTSVSNGLSNGPATTATTAVTTTSTPGQQFASAALTAMQRELPSDPVNQVLLAVYFFLVGMLVRGHPYMWILPTVSSLCAVLSSLVHVGSLLLVPVYRNLSLEKQAWWCADVIHLAYSAVVSVASLLYVCREPRAVLLHAQPTDTHTASVIIASATGFFAFHLWLCVRYRLFNNTARAIVQYTLLLMLFGVATYKTVNLPFLATTLVSEISSVFFLAGKLSSLAGASTTSPGARALRVCERTTLVTFRIIPHAIITLIVLITPSAFATHWYYAAAVLGLVYMNMTNAHKARLSFKSGPGAAAGAGAARRVDISVTAGSAATAAAAAGAGANGHVGNGVAGKAHRE